jgi:hypothetical protein
MLHARYLSFGYNPWCGIQVVVNGENCRLNATAAIYEGIRNALAFAVAYVAVAITHFIPFEVGDLVQAP